jgi:hypothetical protein
VKHQPYFVALGLRIAKLIGDPVEDVCARICGLGSRFARVGISSRPKAGVERKDAMVLRQGIGGRVDANSGPFRERVGVESRQGLYRLLAVLEERAVRLKGIIAAVRVVVSQCVHDWYAAGCLLQFEADKGEGLSHKDTESRGIGGVGGAGELVLKLVRKNVARDNNEQRPRLNALHLGYKAGKQGPNAVFVIVLRYGMLIAGKDGLPLAGLGCHELRDKQRVGQWVEMNIGDDDELTDWPRQRLDMKKSQSKGGENNQTRVSQSTLSLRCVALAARLRAFAGLLLHLVIGGALGIGKHVAEPGFRIAPHCLHFGVPLFFG